MMHGAPADWLVDLLRREPAVQTAEIVVGHGASALLTERIGVLLKNGQRLVVKVGPGSW
jgi:hypothetical protein